MVRSDFTIPQSFIVENSNSKQRINFNSATNMSFWNRVVILVSSDSLRKIVRVTCGSKEIAMRIC